MRGLADGSTRGPTTDSNNGTEHERTSIQDLPRHGGPTFSNLLLYKTHIVTKRCTENSRLRVRRHDGCEPQAFSFSEHMVDTIQAHFRQFPPNSITFIRNCRSIVVAVLPAGTFEQPMRPLFSRKCSIDFPRAPGK